MKMLKKISAVKARNNLGQVMNEVAIRIRGDDYIIERPGQPMVVMIPMDRYYQILQTQEQTKKSLEEIWEKMEGVNEEEIGQVIGEAISSVRVSKPKFKKK